MLDHPDSRLSLVEDPDPVHPIVTTASQRVFFYEGENVTLTCEEWALCDANQPMPIIAWYHDDEEDLNHTEMKRQCRKSGKYIFHLTRRNVTIKDQGNYRCEVNQWGEPEATDSKTIELVIVHKGFLDVTSERSVVGVQLGNNVTMECVTTYPDVATLGEFWAMGAALLQTNKSRYTTGNPMVAEDRNSTQNETENKAKLQGKKVKFSLTIHSVTQGDLGLYECGVNTTLGIEKASIQLGEIRAMTSSPNLTTESMKPSSALEPLHIVLITGGAILMLGLVSALAIKCYRQYEASPDIHDSTLNENLAEL